MLMFLRRNLALVTLLLVTIAVGAMVYSSLHNQRIQADTCRQVEALKTVVRQVITQSAATLGRKGTPGYAYYRAHPEELRVAKRDARIELSEFGPRRC